MNSLWEVPGHGEIVEVEDRHLDRWRQIATDVEMWMHLPHFTLAAPSTARAESERNYGTDWVSLMRAEDPETGRGMLRDLALEDDTGELLAAVSLCGDVCPLDHVSLAVSLTIAVHVDRRGRRVGQALVAEAPDFVKAMTGLDHVVAHECSGNVPSLAMVRKAGWDLAGDRERCDINHPRWPPVPCDGTNLLFCAGVHVP